MEQDGNELLGPQELSKVVDMASRTSNANQQEISRLVGLLFKRADSFRGFQRNSMSFEEFRRILMYKFLKS